MATNTLQTDLSPGVKSDLTATDVATAILAPLASIKLTVFLLFTAIAVVFIATLQQASMDMWSVKYMHYDNWFVTIPFQHLLIERWFPDYQNVPGSFVIPSGKLMIYALIVNLVAAHLLRFRVKAKGFQLWIGIVTMVVAGVVTWAMSFNTFGADGFQKAPPISYSQMWLMMQVILLGMALSCIAGIFLTASEKRMEKAILGVFALIIGFILAVSMLLGKDSFIGDSGMRILWQLCQATLAACVTWGACILLFQRKAGIVLLHIGVVGLMANELYVTYTNVETQIQFFEGDSSSVAVDSRESEFVILDQSDPDFDEMVTIPESLLKSGELVSDPRLPFSVRCEKFYDNSKIERSAVPDSNVNGIGRLVSLAELPISVSNRKVDLASARVELISTSGESMGSWIVSQNLRDFADSIEVDGKKYRIGLRYKTEYKPYKLKLDDVKAEFYTGTETPKWFSSKVVLTDLQTDSSTEHEIWMNNPLRYNGETFYQTGYDVIDGREHSAIQIVKNRGWMIPYICCMFTVVGLAGQFGSSLLGFLKKSRTSVRQQVSGIEHENSFNWKSPGFLVPAGLVAVLALYALSGAAKSMRPVMHEAGMRLDRFGEIPITHKGRIQPLDSFARNTARQFSKREFVYDGNLVKQHAIRWLADTIFRVDGYDDYRVFRIEDLEVLDSLDLPKQGVAGEPTGVRFRYSLDQLKNSPRKILAVIPPPGSPESQWSQYQTRMSQLLSRVQKTVGFSSLLADGESSVANRLDRQRGRVMSTLGDRTFPVRTADWPRFVPQGGDQWEALSDAENRSWLASRATELDVATVQELYPKLLEQSESLTSYRADESASVLDQIDLERMLFTPERIAEARDNGAKTTEEIAIAILESPAARRIRMMVFNQSDQLINDLLIKINGGQNEIADSDSPGMRLASLFRDMGVAYRAGDAATFNSLTDQYLREVRDADQVREELGQLGAERIYNGWSPFFTSMFLYIFAFALVACSWLTSFNQKIGRTLGRTAIAIVVVALVVHSLGLVLRVYISARPPITNLYSSVLFVSAIFVVVTLIIEAMTRLGVGTAMGAVGAFGALLWAWTMTIVDGDTFSVLVAVLDTQFWLSTHVVCISIGYAVMFAAGFIALAYILAAMLTPAMDANTGKLFSNIIYGVTCFALFFSFFGTVLGGLWGDDSWGRFWGWDPKENGALMIVLWSALILHARWGGLVRERGIAILAILGNIVVLWSWKGVNSMNVGLHAYAGSEDNTFFWIVVVALAHLLIAGIALLPTKYWVSHLRSR